MRKLIMTSYINKQRSFKIFWWFYYFCCIILFSFLLPINKIFFESFLTPSLANRWIRNWCKCWHWSILPGFQCNCKSPMSTHAKTSNWSISETDWKITWYYLRQLFSNISIHLEMFFVFFRSAVNIKTCRISKLPIVTYSLNICISRTCIWEHHCNSMFLCICSETWF